MWLLPYCQLCNYSYTCTDVEHASFIPLVMFLMGGIGNSSTILASFFFCLLLFSFFFVCFFVFSIIYLVPHIHWHNVFLQSRQLVSADFRLHPVQPEYSLASHISSYCNYDWWGTHGSIGTHKKLCYEHWHSTHVMQYCVTGRCCNSSAT